MSKSEEWDKQEKEKTKHIPIFNAMTVQALKKIFKKIDFCDHDNIEVRAAFITREVLRFTIYMCEIEYIKCYTCGCSYKVD